MMQVWAMAQGTFCPQEFACFHNGFVVASRKRLHLQTKQLYQYFLSLFRTPADHPLRANENLYRTWQGLPEEWPTLGHVMERSWNALLNCTDVSIVKRCDDSCERHECIKMERCQCLDDESLPERRFHT
jgi:hypothetical protein